MKIQIKRQDDFGIIGLVRWTLSIQRQWGGDRGWTRGATWRHVSLVMLSPALLQPAHIDAEGKRRVTWHRLRFGFGAGNLYLGALYITTTFGKQHPPLAYATWGPFEWARQPSMAEYLKSSRTY